MTPPKSKRVRAHKPKVRTGCKTCKIRRVKCDETKPQCHRCLKFGRECDGYEDTSDSSTTSRRSRGIVARSSSLVTIVPLTPIVSQPTTTLHTGPDDYQSFRFFQEHTAPALSGGFRSSIWNGIVLQASCSEPVIHRLLVSIGALSRATTSPSEDSIVITNRRRYAFHEYGNALHGVRALAKSGNNRSVLMASMLIYCFESLYGNLSGAIKYLKSARNITLGTTGPLVYRHLTPLPSPPEDIEQDLITAFARLDGCLANRLESRNPTRPSILGVELDYNNEPYELPKRFADPETARKYLEHIQHRSRPSRSSAEIMQPDSSQTQDPDRKFSTSELKLLNEQLRGWERSFEPLFLFARTPSGSKDYIAVMTLKIQGLSTACLLEGLVGIVHENASPTPLSDKILEICQDMVKYGWELVNDKRFTKGFMFEFGIIPGLMVAVVTTPDKALAREVVKILRAAAPRREATFDAAKMADICEGILMMQEMQSSPPEKQNQGVELVEMS